MYLLTLTLLSLNRVCAALCDVCCLPNISFSLMTKKSSMFVCKDLLLVGFGISLFPDPHLYSTCAQIHWSHRVPELFRAETFTWYCSPSSGYWSWTVFFCLTRLTLFNFNMTSDQSFKSFWNKHHQLFYHSSSAIKIRSPMGFYWQRNAELIVFPNI